MIVVDVVKNRKSKIEKRKSLNAPLRFEPYLRPMVWGGRRLGEVLHKPLPTPQHYGESWEVSDHPHHYSHVAEGPFAGVTLRKLMEQHREELLGDAADSFETFPWLFKFLDAADWLSVQVHPDAEAVMKLWPGEGSKTEAWFVIEAQPGSRIYAGLKPGVDEQRFRDALKTGTVAECLHSFEPLPGDCVFLPAGTVHAVGGGVLMAEIQQTSDATFRLFDWNRVDAQGKARTLHIEEGMACIHWNMGPVTPIRVESERRQTLVDCPEFRVEYLRQSNHLEVGGLNRLQMMVILGGTGVFGVGQNWGMGQARLLPAALPRTEARPKTELTALLYTLP